VRTIIASFVALLAAVLVTLAVKQDNGYVLIGYGQWTIEGSLALFALVGLLLFLILHIGMRMLSHIWSMPEQMKGWRQKRRGQRARQALTRGLLELAEGRWKLAERHLTRYVSQSETPLLNYLSAARAAQLQGEHERRDDYLQLAHESMPSADVAVGITQAELQLAHQQYEQALATLMHVRSLSPKHDHVMKLLIELYENLGEWQKLEEMLPDLKRRKVISEQASQTLEIKIYSECLKQQSGELESLVNYWQTLPKTAKQQQSILLDYCRNMVALGAGSRVEPLIASSLQQAWNPELVTLYGQIQLVDPAPQLASAEIWLRQHPEDPVLLLTLARLSLQNKLWGKGRSYLEASIAIHPTPESYQKLGLLLEHLGEKDKAMQYFRAGLGLLYEEPKNALPHTPMRTAVSSATEPIKSSSVVQNV
jgi:HemY protein